MAGLIIAGSTDEYFRCDRIINTGGRSITLAESGDDCDRFLWVPFLVDASENSFMNLICTECEKKIRPKLTIYNGREYLIPYCKRCKLFQEDEMDKIKLFSEGLDAFKKRMNIE